MAHVVTPSKVLHESDVLSDDVRDRLSSVKGEKVVRVEGVWCKMKYSVVVAGVKTEVMEPLVNETVKEVLGMTEKAFSNFLGDSEVTVINNLPVGESIEVSPAFHELYSLASTVEGIIPTFSIQYASHGAYTMTNTPPMVTKNNEGTLDFCGIAKGWAVQRILDTIVAKSPTRPTGVLVSWAGDVSAMGRHPSGGNWVVSVAEQEEDSPILTTLKLSDGESAATSGSIGIFLTKTGETITNSDISTITVVSRGGCAVADALATGASACTKAADAARALERAAASMHKRNRVTQWVVSDTERKLLKSHVRGVEDEHLHAKRMKLHHTDGTVIIIGGGLAGMCAAIEAAKVGANVVLLEKMNKVGGNSAKATSGINGWGTSFQGDEGVQDNEALFERDTHLSGAGGLTNPSLVRLLSTQSAEAIRWLSEEVGVEFTALSQLGGASRPRAHRTSTPVGFTMVTALQKYIEEHHKDKVTIVTQAKLKKLVQCDKEEEVRGVVYIDSSVEPHKEVTVMAQAVVLATGGYGFSCRTLEKYRPDLASMPTTNGPWAVGDVYDVVEPLHVSLVDMDKVQLHPTGLVNPKDEKCGTKILGPEALRGSGGVLVSSKGERFINELELRSVVAKAIDERGGFAYCIMNAAMQEKFGKKSLEFYEGKMGLFKRCADVTAAAKHIGCSPGVLKTTIDTYEQSCKAGRCLLTDKVVFPEKLSSCDKNLLVAKVTPAIHYTMGGMEISGSCEVQKRLGAKDGTLGNHVAVKRLFAAGECTGGVHGNNRLGGNSLLECVVMGRTAGQRAGTVNQRSSVCFAEDDWTPVTFRELRNPDTKYGRHTMLLRFNLPGSLLSTGLCLGEFIVFRGKLHGESHVVSGYYSPVTRPQDLGCIDLLMRVDDRGGINGKFFASLRPGDALEMRSMGGLKLSCCPETKEWSVSNTDKMNGVVRRFNLVAGGTGIAPMVQIVRGLKRCSSTVDGIKLVFAAETDSDLSLATQVEKIHDKFPKWFNHHFILNHPPLGWTEGVNFLDIHTVRRKLHGPTPDTMTVICGPPIFERIAKKFLKELGHTDESIFTYSGC